MTRAERRRRTYRKIRRRFRKRAWLDCRYATVKAKAEDDPHRLHKQDFKESDYVSDINIPVYEYRRRKHEIEIENRAGV